MRFVLLIGFVFAIGIFVGCKKNDSGTAKVENKPFDPATYENYGPIHPDPLVTVRTMENGEPSHISIQHVLIGFLGSIENPNVERDREEAEKLAKAVFEKALAGDDFDTLVEDYTDDKIPGIYKLANFNVAGHRPGTIKKLWVWERTDMVPGFGDVGFKLDVGEIGMSEYDPVKSKLGWHIIKRVK